MVKLEVKKSFYSGPRRLESGPMHANRRRLRRTGPEMLSRQVEISGLRTSVHIRAEHRRGEEPELDCGPWLELRGRLEEPVNGVATVTLSIYPREPQTFGPVRPASVGAVIGLRPEMSVVIDWPHQEFDRLWAMALTGHLKFAHLYFTKPKYGHGLVVNASFSSEKEE